MLLAKALHYSGGLRGPALFRAATTVYPPLPQRPCRSGPRFFQKRGISPRRRGGGRGTGEGRDRGRPQQPPAAGQHERHGMGPGWLAVPSRSHVIPTIGGQDGENGAGEERRLRNPERAREMAPPLKRTVDDSKSHRPAVPPSQSTASAHCPTRGLPFATYLHLISAFWIWWGSGDPSLLPSSGWTRDSCGVPSPLPIPPPAPPSLACWGRVGPRRLVALANRRAWSTRHGRQGSSSRGLAQRMELPLPGYVRTPEG